MEKIKLFLENITDVWNNHFWDSKFCQSKINFTKDVQTNYYGDILDYFEITLELLQAPKVEQEFKKSIFQSIGILQIIYAQQDLIDELLYIFKLDTSKLDDKNPNRTIRNELVGHPVRKEPGDGELISSVFFGRDFGNGQVNYVLYSRDNDFHAKTVNYPMHEILFRHQFYLEKYSKYIWDQIKKILRLYKKNLMKLQEISSLDIEFEKLVALVEQRFSKIQKEDYLFKTDVLLRAYKKRDQHIRYQNVITLFLETLKDHLQGTIENIDESLQPSAAVKVYEPVELKIQIVETGKNQIRLQDQKNMQYEFSKLFDNHPLWGISYFKTKFSADEHTMTELKNMEDNERDTLEFYASIEVIRLLLIKKSLLKKR